MKLTHKFCDKGSARAGAGFTLPEMMISLTIFVLLLISVIGIQIFGTRWFGIAQTKLVATTSAWEAINKMRDEIKTCSSIYVGSVTNGVFTAPATGNLLVGSSLLIYPSTNSTNFIMYFYNAPDQTFRRTTSATNSTTIAASTVTNSIIFQMQDCFGNVLSNSQQNFVIHCQLVFYTAAPKSPMPNYYKLETAVNPRLLD